MLNALKAGFFTAVAVFAVGFALGTLRVFVIEPAIGETTAVAIELPVMLGICWLVARAIFRRTLVERASPRRFGAALVALVVLVGLETALGLLFGLSVAAQGEAYLSLRGLFTALGQLGFALIVFLA